jgi:hypothetical protein
MSSAAGRLTPLDKSFNSIATPSPMASPSSKAVSTAVGQLEFEGSNASGQVGGGRSKSVCLGVLGRSSDLRSLANGLAALQPAGTTLKLQGVEAVPCVESEDDDDFGVLNQSAGQCTVPAVDEEMQPDVDAGSLAASAGSALLRLHNSSCSLAPAEQLEGQQGVDGSELCYVRCGGMLKAAEMLRLPPV